MAATTPPPRPLPVVLRARLRYETEDQFVERFAANVGRAGIFLASKTPRAVGTEIRFELRLATEVPVLVGVGTVRECRIESAGPPRIPGGLLVAFTRVTAESRAVIHRMLSVRKSLGYADDEQGLPSLGPAKDSERVRTLTVGITDDASPTMGTTPPPRRGRTVPPPPPITSTPRPARQQTSPGIVAPSGSSPAIRPPAAAEPVLAAESVAEPVPTPPELPLAPVELPPAVATPIEARRRRSPRQTVSELLASLNAKPPQQNPGPDTNAEAANDAPNLQRAVMRARALAGNNLDEELAALTQVRASAPHDSAIPSVTIDEVSARLARAVGGTAVVRADRSGPLRGFMPQLVTRAGVAATSHVAETAHASAEGTDVLGAGFLGELATKTGNAPESDESSSGTPQLVYQEPVNTDALLATDDDFYIPVAALSGMMRAPTPPAPVPAPPPSSDDSSILSGQSVARIRLKQAPYPAQARTRTSATTASPNISRARARANAARRSPTGDPERRQLDDDAPTPVLPVTHLDDDAIAISDDDLLDD